MDDILQALAKMLNMTVDEVSSLLTTFKGNAPQIYEMFVKEKMFYNLFSLFQIMSIVIFSISAVVLAVLTLIIKDRWVVDYMSNFSSEESIEIIGNIYENLVYIF